MTCWRQLCSALLRRRLSLLRSDSQTGVIVRQELRIRVGEQYGGNLLAIGMGMLEFVESSLNVVGHGNITGLGRVVPI